MLAGAALLGMLAMAWLGPQRLAHAEGAGVAPHTATGTHQQAGVGHGPHEHAQDLDEHDEQDHSHALDLLLGLLMALFVAVLTSLWSRVPRRPMVILRRVRWQMLNSGRPPDPPCLTRLSIQRC